MTDPMSYKKYWNQFSGSQDNLKEIATYDSMMAEYYAIKGIPVEYFTINVDEYKEGMDQVYGENSRPKWDKKIPMLAILEDFTPETQQWSGIGLENVDEAVFFIHKTTFDKIVGIRSQLQQNKSPLRRGAYGPIAKDQIRTLHNGLIYEVVTGGAHFLPGDAQHFGQKFWYKLTCKVRQVSDAVLGEGEQYGAIPDETLDAKWKGNPQFLLENPKKEDWEGKTGTPSVQPPSGSPVPDCNNPPEYTTQGTPSGPVPVSSNDLLDPNTGQVKQQHVGVGLKENSLFGDNKDIEKEADQIINPTTDLKADPNNSEDQKYGPHGRIIKRKERKELFGDW